MLVIQTGAEPFDSLRLCVQRLIHSLQIMNNQTKKLRCVQGNHLDTPVWRGTEVCNEKIAYSVIIAG